MKEKEKVLFVSNLDMYVENTTIKRLKIFSSQIFFLHLPPTIIIQINRTNTIDLLKIISLQVLNLCNESISFDVKVKAKTLTWQ